ncbi:MAG: hypothetical protein R3C59_26660 [Planctomycetaceae bacterium]
MDVVLEQASTSFSVSSFDHTPPVLLSTAEILLANDYDELVAEVQTLQRRRVRNVSIRRQRAMRIGKNVLKCVLQDAGMEVCTLGFAGGFTGTLGRTWKQAVDDTRRALELASELQARAVVVLPGCRGLHTYNHAERCVREGLEGCLDDALRFRVDMLVPLNSVLGTSRDVFQPQQTGCMDWIDSFETHRIKAMMVLRGGSPWARLPGCWERCLESGGALRISGRTRRLLGRHDIVRRILASMENAAVPVS